MLKRLLVLTLALSLTACTKMHAKPMSQGQMMENMKQAGMVGEQHEFLKQLVGNWKAETTMWYPGAEQPEQSTGTASFSPIYGGRYVSMTYKGKFMNEKFAGQGVLGYDNVKGKYFSTWIDSMTTGQMLSEGSKVNDNMISFNSTAICPGTREEMKTVEQLAVQSKNMFTWTSFADDNGKLNKMMEIKYSRIQ